MRFSALLTLCLALACAPSPVHAWKASIVDTDPLPPKLVVINKGAKTLSFLEKSSALRVSNVFPSIHGEIEGDKQVSGDLKTPEGVYFVTGPITFPLDFDEYGSQAYALNYPNPVDRLRGKTGHGIWIHSKGRPIRDQVTKGCVAIDLKHIDILGPELKPGTAVIMADEVAPPVGSQPLTTTNEPQNNVAPAELMALVEGIPQNLVAMASTTSAPILPASTSSLDAGQAFPLALASAAESIPAGADPLAPAPEGTFPQPNFANADAESNKVNGNVAQEIIQKTAAWNKAWAGRSADMFNFYDAASYSKAQGESFGAFQAQKESLFTTLPWIQIIVGETHVLQGPDYWVSWFRQYYRAPNHKTEGIRRLYWQPVEGGEIKIVGMEWLPADLGMERDYLNTLAPSVVAFVEEWRAAWEKGDLKTYKSMYRADAEQDNRRGEDIFSNKERIWKTKKPAKVELSGLRVSLSDRGVQVDMTQLYKDSSGYSDRGLKVMLLYPHGDTWRIAQEKWSAR